MPGVDYSLAPAYVVLANSLENEDPSLVC